MRKSIIAIFAILICMGLLTGCGAHENKEISNHDTAQQESSSSVSDYSASYQRLILYKTTDYSKESVAAFNQSLIPENGDLSELLAAYAEAIEEITPDDENYDYITLTFAASLKELYCEQMNEEVSRSGHLKKTARPIEPLQSEEKRVNSEEIYDFMVYAKYNIQYSIVDPALLSVKDRDSALRNLQIGLQSYLEELSEDEIIKGDIRSMLEKKADELLTAYSSDNFFLTVEIGRIEILYNGKEIIMD